MRNQKCELRNSRGFSLIELIFAMSFLTLIILGVISLQSGNLAMINRQNNQIQAHFYANQGIQILKTIGYTAINSAYQGCGDPCNKEIVLSGSTYSLGSNPPQKLADNLFERTIEISKPSGLVNAFKVTSRIEWVDSTGEHRRIVNGKLVNADVQAKIIIF